MLFINLFQLEQMPCIPQDFQLLFIDSFLIPWLFFKI